MDQIASKGADTSWGLGSMFLTSNSDKHSAMQDLLVKFTVGSHYQDLLSHVKSNLDKLSELRNVVASFGSNFMCCDVATAMQEAFVLLAMKKYGVAKPDQVMQKHIEEVVDDLLLLSADSKGRRYDISTNQRVDIIHLRHTGCNVTEGQAALTSRLASYEISAQAINSVVKIPPYHPPLSIPMALRSSDKYPDFTEHVLPGDTSNQGRGISTPTNQGNPGCVNSVWAASQIEGIPRIPEGLDISNIAEVRIGDTSGNIILDIQQLIQTGVLQVKDPETYAKLMSVLDQAIYESVPRDGYPYYTYHEAFPALLGAALQHNPASSASVLYFGDRLNDNVGNDLYVTDLTNFLSETGVEYAILASNHDLEAVRGYLKLKDSIYPMNTIACAMTVSMEEFVHSTWPGFTSCMKTLHENPTYYDQYQRGMENYIQHMVVYGFDQTTGLLCGHAPPSERSVNEIASKAGIANPIETDLATKVGIINCWLKNTVLKNITKFERRYPDKPNINYIESPLYSATSGTGCACDEPTCTDIRGLWGVSGKRIDVVPYQIPTGALHVEHGHIYTPAHEKGDRADGTTITTLDSDFGCDPFVSSTEPPLLHRIFGNHKVGLTMRERTANL